MKEMKFDHDQKVIVYVMGLLSELARDGLVEEGSLRISKEGEYEYAKLKEEGFEITSEEMGKCMIAIQEMCLNPPAEQNEH